MAIDTDRAALHAIIDALPDDRLADAKAALDPLVDSEAPGYPDVPEDDEPVTDEDLADLAATHEAYLRGELIPHDRIKREMGW